MKELFHWLTKLKVSRVVLLSSLDAIERQDREIMNPFTNYYIQRWKRNQTDANDLQKLMTEKGVRPLSGENGTLELVMFFL